MIQWGEGSGLVNAVAQGQSLTWEFPYAVGVAKKRGGGNLDMEPDMHRGKNTGTKGEKPETDPSLTAPKGAKPAGIWISGF